jgi:hypothetical protein
MGNTGTPRSGAANDAFGELEHEHGFERARHRLAMPTTRPERGVSAWKAFAVALVTAAIVTQFIPLHTGVNAVMVAKRLADPILTSSH